MKLNRRKDFWNALFYDEPPKLAKSWGGRIVQALFIGAILWGVLQHLFHW